MDLFARVEQALEGMVEGVFTRAFRAPLQPIEVAKRLAREMEQKRTVSVNTTYVPNVYTVHLAPEAYDTFDALGHQVIVELEHFLRDLASEREYAVVGAITVRLAEDAALKPHEFRVETASIAAPPKDAAAPPATTDQQIDRTMLIAARPTALQHGSETIPLRDGMTIGRDPANTLILGTPGVSRRHAEIIDRNGAWVIRDLGSTNGTLVNGKRIPEHVLKAGEIIQLGEERLTVV